MLAEQPRDDERLSQVPTRSAHESACGSRASRTRARVCASMRSGSAPPQPRVVATRLMYQSYRRQEDCWSGLHRQPSLEADDHGVFLDEQAVGPNLEPDQPSSGPRSAEIISPGPHVVALSG